MDRAALAAAIYERAQDDCIVPLDPAFLDQVAGAGAWVNAWLKWSKAINLFDIDQHQ